jgi:hypothetical protein
MFESEPHSERRLSAVYYEFIDAWNDPERRQAGLAAYTSGQHSFVPNLLPEQALHLSTAETLDILRQRLGPVVDVALHPAHTDPDTALDRLPTELRSPVADRPDGGWLKRANVVGINVRTVGSFWNIVKYALTLPDAQDSIHILPIWEAGVAGSMYGITSWNLNPEFYSDELAATFPTLNRLAWQLRAVVNLLHVMGKTVGMDVIPHTDRYSQIALAFPEHFEWLQREDVTIVDHGTDLHEKVQAYIAAWLREQGPAVAGDSLPERLYDPDVPEAQRMRLLFGLPEDLRGREVRRNLIIQRLYRYGYEPVPGTMAPPFRGLAVDPRPEAKTVDEYGQVWRDYVITRPEPMSRVFGPLTRFKLYERVDDNAEWEVDFARPREPVWAYVCDRYAEVQRRYGFDYMRGDMSHVQMRPQGVPSRLDARYDLLGAVKAHVRARGAPYFGYLAESFLAPRDVMGYGEEMDHLEASQADAVLGDLQSTVVGSTEFLQRLRQYHDYAETRRCAPTLTCMTADKDDPRFDEFYVGGNEVRLFLALFFTAMPSYMGLGFETRDTHLAPAPNEHYTKLYVFQMASGPKATQGSYVWGVNGHLFSAITRLRLYADAVWPTLAGRPVRWLIPPDATAHNKVIAWTQADAHRSGAPQYVFLANTDVDRPVERFGLPLGVAPPGDITPPPVLAVDFSTAATIPAADRTLPFNGVHYCVTHLAPGEARVYRVCPDKGAS